VDAATDLHMLELSSLHKMADLPFGKANPLRELFWRF
jgi:hypothetical protein